MAPKALKRLWRAYLLGLRHEVNLGVEAFAALAARDQATYDTLFRKSIKVNAADVRSAKRLGTRCSG